VSLLVAIGVNSESYREILGICEGAKVFTIREWRNQPSRTAIVGNNHETIAPLH
jgi:transposase-like protein